MIRISLILCSLFLCACVTTPTPSPQSVPTSERLEQVKAQRLASLAQEFDSQGLVLGAPVFIRVFKSERMVEAWVKSPEKDTFVPFKSYPICKFSGYLGPKLQEGDHQAPEGFYMVSSEQLNPNSRFHLSFDLGFPNAYDRAHRRTGSLLMIHGGCKSEGCFAITDGAMEEVYMMVEASIAGGADVPVHIFPFRMTEGNLAMHYALGWNPFWQNLKEGYDAFEQIKIPPKARHQSYKYVFETPERPDSLGVLTNQILRAF